jgi:hypothetical protein
LDWRCPRILTANLGTWQRKLIDGVLSGKA